MKNFDPNELLLETSGILVIDLLNELINIDSLFLETIAIEPETGLYLAGDIDPFYKLPKDHVLLNSEGEEFYKELDLLVNQLKQDKTIDNPIVKLDDYAYKRMKHLIRNKPTIPSMSLKIMSSVIMNHIHHVCKYTNGNIAKEAYPFIKPEYKDVDNIDSLETIFDELIMKVDEFIKKDRWHVYFIKIKRSVIYIEKTIDYRIYDWYRLKNEYEPQHSLYH